MEKSFRDILTQMLDGFEDIKGESRSTPPNSLENLSVEQELFASIEFPKKMGTHQTVQNPTPFARTRYGGASPKTKPSPPPPNLIALSNLSAKNRELVELLLRLGALELESGLNEELLKKAYRRLAKAYHPDTRVRVGSNTNATGVSPDAFLKLKNAYDQLLMFLKFNGSAYGSESASESKCPHQDAA